ncbi:hypothetical protein AURDEDRAFT_89881 [Auricularia subglabra TFB-10046 SS5]|nr:hypothetical protein AURDEDRAFT_89881 [Auricularia subglabra TFB-10046 SS5]
MGDVERNYGVKASRADRAPSGAAQIRKVVCRDAIVRALEHGAYGVRAWVLVNVLELEWDTGGDDDDEDPFEDEDEDQPRPPRPPAAMTALQAHIAARASHRFLVVAPALLRSHDEAPRAALALLTSRILPSIQPDDASATGAVGLVLELLALREGAALVLGWCQSNSAWSKTFEAGMGGVIAKAEWPAVIRVVSALSSELDGDLRARAVGLAIPKLFDRLANTPPPHARDAPALAYLLTHLSTAHKHLFYKPVIQCATAAKELTVIAHLRVLQAIARLLPDFWIADCELMALALLGEAGRLGQSVLVLQIIEDVRKRAGGKTSRAPPASQTQAVKFYTELETRIAVLTTAREKNTPLPFSHRLLIVALLLDIRQFTWSPRSPPWLPRVLNWTLHALPPDESAELAEVGATISKMRNVYMGCSDAQSSTNRQSRSTLLFSPTSLEPVDQMLPATQDESMSVFAALPSQLAAGCAKLLVLVSQLFTPSDTEQLGAVLWSRYLDSDDTSVLEPACFLVMQVAEWRTDFADDVRNDLKSAVASVRRKAVRRISALFAWRFQIMSQAFISDRSRRRPFHTTRRALSFVPVDVGSGNFVLEENEAELKARFGDALPRDTIRRLLEIDWVQENKPPDKRLELIRTPFSVLPSSQLDRGIEAAPETQPSPSASSSRIHTSSSGNLSPSSPGGSPGKPHLMRRKSSTSSSIGVVKRRPVFVQTLLGVLPALAVSVRDADVFTSSAARDLLVDFMREDAGTMCRPLMDTISSDGLKIVQVIDDIRAFLHVQQILPPAMSHIVFTHLAGFLRGVSRVEKDKALMPANNLLTFAYTVPILAKLVAQVSNLSAQDLRRAKAEVFLLPSGPLWFSSAAPLGPMFPRDLDEAGNVPQRDTLDEIPPALVAMTMIRTSQNMLLLSLLKRNPQDITVVRKNLNRLVLPTREASSGLKQLVVGDFIPRSPEAMRNKGKDLGLARISIALSRSYLLLVAQIFRCLPRTLSDRAELGRLLDGVNRILLTHGDDIGIVSHALIACMVATTRFRRLFSSSSAFTLFMPSLIKVYCEATDQAGIRRAIEYAMSRFYQFHEDVVIFQTLDIASYMAAHPSAEPILASLASGLVSLMSSLKSPPIAADGDAAGIHGINRDQEQEAWDAITIEKKPETLPLLLQSRAEAAADAKSIATLDASQPKRFVTNNLVKFLLTIIAHDTSILRSEQFLRLLRCMTPYLYNMSASARTMLRDGINALGIAIFHRPAAPGVGDASAPARGLFSSDYGDGGVLLGNPLTPCDFAVMRREYLRLIVGFSKAGGALHNPTMRRALDLVKSMLKDPSDEVFSLAERFIVDYIKASHAGDVYKDTNATVYQLREYAAIFQSWCHKCDFSGVLTVLDQLASNPTFAQDYAFSQMVMEQFLRPAVQACDRLAVDGTLFSSNLRLTVVPLLSTALTLSGTDPIGCIEQCNPSPAFLAGIVLPLCIKLRTSTEAAAQIVGIKPVTRDAHTRAWPRLLWYALEACNPAAAKAAPGSRPSSRPTTPDGEKGRPSSAAQTPVATLAVVLQIVKIIVIRGESDLTASHRGVWDHLGAFLLDVLNGGNAEFGLQISSMPRSISLVLSPSPRTASEPQPSPRALDYLMWSMMHLVCAHRSPLMVPIRLRILEVTAALHLELKRRLGGSASSPVRNTRRFSSSVFAKPRVRSSLMSAPVTPEIAHEATFRGRNRFPESVTPERTAGRRIRHLGLAANQQQALPLAPASLGANTAGARAAALAVLNNLASVQTIATGTLVRACVRNVRTVQMFAGYELLLPLAASEDAFGEEQAWSEHAAVLSKAGALELVARETALLIQEFRSEFYAAIE